MTQPIPFSVLRAAYQHAVDTHADNHTDNHTEPETVRDYWPECIRLAAEEYVGDKGRNAFETLVRR